MGLTSEKTLSQLFVAVILSVYITACDSWVFATSSDSSPPASFKQSEEPLIPPPRIPGTYDDSFRAASERFQPQHDWRWLKAQCYQESALLPRAVSHAGAMGLCQFMPGTWREVSEALNIRASVYNPKANATAAAYYMGRLESQWVRDRRSIERLRLAQASYNGGLGRILEAQRRCDDALLWKDIEPCVRAKETREYVPRIAGWYYELTGRRE